MSKQKSKIEFRYYEMPIGEYIRPLLGQGWEQEYGVGYHGMLHFHNYLEIGYCYHGQGEFIIDDRTYRYGDHMLTWLPANIPHTTNSDDGHICKWEYLFVDIESFIRNEMNGGKIVADDIIKILNKRGMINTRKNYPIIGDLIQNIIREYRSEEAHYRESAKGYLRALVIEMLRIEEKREQARRNVRLGHYVKGAIEYIGQNYEKDIKVADIAADCGLSESHFRRIFEESMNMKPVDYINLVRIKNACELIENEDNSMNQVGIRVGYLTPSSFNRNFKRLTGMTPHQWKVEKVDKERTNIKGYKISAKPGWEA